MARLRAAFTGPHRAFALGIVACALLLRLLVPGGWMPGVGADGMVRITLCTGQGMVEAYVDTAGAIHEKAPGHSDPKTDQPCAFAGLALASLGLADFALSIPAFAATAAPVLRLATIAIGHGLAAPPPPATGPPAPF